MPARVIRVARRAPLAGEVLVAYARAQRRMSREQDVRRLLAATRRVRPGRRRAATLPEAQRVARVASIVLAWMPTDPRCLVRSLVVIELLARRGIDARLVIGTSGAKDFSAHAWVELGGQALLPTAGFTTGRLAEL